MSTGLLDQPVLILDGGLGTTLEDEHGIKFSISTPLWSSHLLISEPQVLMQVQRDFADAGADIILTPTYQASQHGFSKTGISTQDATKYMHSAVSISRAAANGAVALSLGAYGAILQPSQEYSGRYGDIDENGLERFHAERLAEFESSWNDIDLVAFETLPRLDEVRAAKRAFKGTKPYWISCVFPQDEHLPDGTGITELLPHMLAGILPWAIGINCTKINRIAALVQNFEESAGTLGLDLPRLVLYPDGTNGSVYDTEQQKWIGNDEEGPDWAEQLTDIIRDVLARGRWQGIVVGGCCKTSPAHIRKLRARIDKLLQDTVQ